MSKESVIFIHGWHGDKTTYGELPKILAREGYDARHIFLSEYVTGWDDITIDDLAIGFQAALEDKGILPSGAFHTIVHSTGALVVRNWIHRYYGGPSRPEFPLRHLIMAAPANNGSRLASWGKKLPWDWGNNILKALELASPVSWDLNVSWMKAEYAYRPNFFPSLLIAGNNKQELPFYAKPFSKALAPMEKDMPVFEEEGSDNTVRACAANLNMRYLRREYDQPTLAIAGSIADIPIWYFPNRAHSGNTLGILKAIKSKNDEVAQTVIQILKVTDRRNPGHGDRPPGGLPKDYTYAMLNIRVTDQLGNPVPEATVWWYEDPKGALEIRHSHDAGDIVCFYVKKSPALKNAGFYVDAPEKGGVLFSLRWKYKRTDPPVALFEEGNFDHMPNGQTTFVEVKLYKEMGGKVFKLEPLE